MPTEPARRRRETLSIEEALEPDAWMRRDPNATYVALPTNEMWVHITPGASCARSESRYGSTRAWLIPHVGAEREVCPLCGDDDARRWKSELCGLGMLRSSTGSVSPETWSDIAHRAPFAHPSVSREFERLAAEAGAYLGTTAPGDGLSLVVLPRRGAKLPSDHFLEVLAMSVGRCDTPNWTVALLPIPPESCWGVYAAGSVRIDDLRAIATLADDGVDLGEAIELVQVI